MKNRTFIAKAAHTITQKDGSSKLVWLPIGRITIFTDEGGKVSQGIMRLNHVPDVSYQLFESDE